MTSDTAKPQTKLEARPETFRSHLPAIAAATTGTVLAAILGSLIGAAGTIAGIVIGSLASGTASWWAERGIRRSAALAAARAEAIRARGRPLHPGEDAAVAQAAVITRDTAAARGAHDRPRLRWRWAGPAAFIAAAFIGCVIVVTLLEGVAGKPLSAVVQGKPGHGTTLGGGTVSKAASPSPSPTPPASTTGTATASTTPSGATSSPAASTAPAATAPGSTSPASSTPNSATPSATPTGTGG
ncbi:MAG TPA: hypothetical protein VGD83_12875 [Streptosporangiaceae bacterium]